MKKDKVKSIIIKLFMNNVKGKNIDISDKKHCGSEGYWLEKQMEIKNNSKNKPDILGYEMKKDSRKITLGDFSASEYLFSKNKKTIEELNKWNNNEYTIKRNEFIRYFGTPNPKKNNRYSWSGNCVPSYGEWNNCGQKLYFTENLDLHIKYSYDKDNREYKDNFPSFLKDEIVIAIWKCDKLKENINKKYNDKGFFICKKINNKYDKICFGRPFNFEYFVENMKKKNIIFDSGMYEGNNRNYSQFRSYVNNFWNLLITEEYE